MNQICGCITALCSITLFCSATVYADEIGEKSKNKPMLPITVEVEKIEAFTREDQFQVGRIVITETSENSFSENQQFCFSIKNKPSKLEIQKKYYEFAEKEKVEVSKDTFMAEYVVQNGNLVVTIKDSDPTKIESFFLPDLTAKKNEPHVVLGTYSLYFSSDTDKKTLPVALDFFEIDEYIPPTPQKPLDIEIKMNEMTLLVNQQKKDLKVPAYISDTGHVMLPVRELSEVFPGMIVLWDNEKKETTILHGADIIIISAGIEDIKYVLENRILLRGAEIKDGRMFINLRDMCKIYGVKDNEILWDSDEKVVTINTTVNDNSKK